MMIFLKILLWIFILYIIPISLSVIFAIIAYKHGYPYYDTVTLEHIYNHYDKDFVDEDGDHYLNFSLFAPVVNIFYMFYFLVLMIYNSTKDIRI